MLLRNVFTKTLRDLRWPTFWVGLSLAVGGAYFTALYPAYKSLLGDMVKQIPPAMQSLLAGTDWDISTATGFLNIELFPLILPALMAGYAIALCSGFTAGEESRGTIDVLLSFPVPRWRVVIDKVAALIVSLAVVSLVMLVGIQIGAIIGGTTVDVGRVAAGLALATILALALGMSALALAAWTGNRNAALGIPIGVMVVMYLVQSLSGNIEYLKSINFLSLFHYYLGHTPLVHGLNLADAFVLLAVGVVFLALGVIGFERRDLSA